MLVNTSILETPREVLEAGQILTNPSQIETAGDVSFAYFRQEPPSYHLGKTTSAPYVLQGNRREGFYLREFADAMVLPGEDPRVMRGIKLASPTGAIHTGWCISTVVATPKPGNPADVESIKQVFYWGERLNTLEPILEIPDLKNTNIFPLARITNDDSTKLDVFARPHPHIAYFQVAKLTDITKERIEDAQNITAEFLPPGIHTGVNNIKAVFGQPNLRELDIHEAFAPITELGKILHYRIGRYGLDLLTGRLTPLGVAATRADFPSADPKPPENGVADYTDIVYGSMGNYYRHDRKGRKLRMTVVGLSDNHVGLAFFALAV